MYRVCIMSQIQNKNKVNQQQHILKLCYDITIMRLEYKMSLTLVQSKLHHEQRAMQWWPVQGSFLLFPQWPQWPSINNNPLVLLFRLVWTGGQSHFILPQAVASLLRAAMTHDGPLLAAMCHSCFFRLQLEAHLIITVITLLFSNMNWGGKHH